VANTESFRKGTHRPFQKKESISSRKLDFNGPLQKAKRIGKIDLKNLASTKKRHVSSVQQLKSLPFILADIVLLIVQNGHCNVPTKYKDNSALGRWVTSMRSDYKHNKLNREKIVRLESLGFQWKIFP